MHEPMAAVKPKRLVEALERLWQERLRLVSRKLGRGYFGEVASLLNSASDYFVPKFTNATRMLKEQLTAEGINVWLSVGCLEEFATIASVAAARTRQANEPYKSCLRREILTRARFIQQWTTSDRNFDHTQCGELVSVARKYALPRPWRVVEAVASARGLNVAVRTPAQGVLKSL